MTLFARCFLLVFCQLGVGGLLSLAVPPFHELERGFFKSSGGVFLFGSLVGGLGTVWLWLTRDASGIGAVEAGLWLLHVGLFAAYLSTLWGEAMAARARLFAAALLAGVAALASSAWALAAGQGAVVHVLAVAATLVGAAALGAVTTGMLIGHWYLIDTSMEIEPFRRCFRWFVWALAAELACVAALALHLAIFPPPGLADHALLFALRVLLGPVAAFGIAFMIHRVLLIPQTMAATGLFYIATLAVLVGEILGRYFTFRTGLPL
ncbi:hypothetical protein KGQ64_15070 [bacterium]|nr:hypothetical protein [bacterium]